MAEAGSPRTVRARALAGGAPELLRQLRRLGLGGTALTAAVERERRAAVLLADVPAAARATLQAQARQQGVSCYSPASAGGEGAEAPASELVLVAPALLLRELARELPVELGAPLDDAVRRALGEGPRLRWRHRRGVLELDGPLLMGVLNLTPDSFSDGGQWSDPEAAVARAHAMVAEGAAIIDVGGESTRPGAEPVPAAEELRRVLPVLQRLAGSGPDALAVPVSIDTRRAEVAREALAAGAAIVNDVTGLADPAMRAVVAEARAGCVIMHMRGEPRTMQQDPRYDDVVGEVEHWLVAAAAQAERDGVAREAIAVDPGLGFGKTAVHNLLLLRHLDAIAASGRPVVVGISRKSFLGRIVAGEQPPREDRLVRAPAERLPAALALSCAAVGAGARVLRTHDVRPTADALAAWLALQSADRWR
ncbi:MAG: hypothetical protein KatS3mg102_0094 [Planctomycetota bacterium]|nr:MAG: hypothetical protein KatS3mg102_0094 [Planctomycetota bacterium]